MHEFVYSSPDIAFTRHDLSFQMKTVRQKISFKLSDSMVQFLRETENGVSAMIPTCPVVDFSCLKEIETSFIVNLQNYSFSI